MKIVEYGKNNCEVIMMLHGGGLSWWNYRSEAELLCDNYHVVLPIIDGHAESDDSFTSIEEAASRLIDYIKMNFGGKIKALCGLSLGAQIAVEMISQDNNICEFSIIESVSLIPSKFTEKLIKPTFAMSYGLIKKKWFSKLQFKSLHIRKDLYDDYYVDTCLITKEDMISFLEANTRYFLKDSIKNTEAKVLIIAGSKEAKNMIKSAELLNSSIMNSNLDIKKGLYHGEFSINKPEEFVSELKNLLN